MYLLMVTLTYSFVAICFCGDEFLFYPADDFFPRQDDLIECPKSCPAESESLCTSNGFCIKLFNGPCQVVDFNCKNGEDFKQIHQEYCEDPRYRNLQPKACVNTPTIAKNLFIDT